MEATDVSVYAIVRVDGLQSAEGRKLNKRIGTVVRLPDAAATEEAACRYEVHIPHREATVGLKRENFTVVYPGYEVRPCESADRGLGMFATRPFSPGETVLVERPIGLRTDWDWESLSASDREQLVKLEAHAHPFIPNASLALKIINTNQYEGAGVCLVLSRVNHDCDANCAFEYDEATGEEILYAVRDVVAGEELTASYVSEWATSEERRSRLAMEKRIFCTCSLCDSHSDRIVARDTTIRRAKQLYDALPSMVGAPIARVDAVAEELLALLAELGPSYNTLKSPIAYDVLQLVAMSVIMQPTLSADVTALLEKWIEKHHAGLQYRSKSTAWEGFRKASAGWRRDPKAFVTEYTKKALAPAARASTARPFAV